jgi:GntR family transcriptional regulator/MocR family aminotransferase
LPEIEAGPAAVVARYDFRPGAPDLGSFPKSAWLKAMGKALAAMEPRDFGYDHRHGTPALREVIAAYLGRVRGVVADPGQVLITSGFEQGRALVARTLRAGGARRIAVENPGYSNLAPLTAAGLAIVPIPVDGQGLDVECLWREPADAVLTTPAHQYPTGVLLGGTRRRRLVAWLREHDAICVEDDYDAEFRYDRDPVAALQGMDPQRVIYAGTVSKILAPALRLGWLVVPPALLAAVRLQHALLDYGPSRLEQHALAALIEGGEFDRHLRRMRLVYRRRREALVSAVVEHIPGASISGIAAGLHAAVHLPGPVDEAALTEACARRGVALEFMSAHQMPPEPDRTILLLGYTRLSEAHIRAGVRALRAALAECV